MVAAGVVSVSAISAGSGGFVMTSNCDDNDANAIASESSGTDNNNSGIEKGEKGPEHSHWPQCQSESSEEASARSDEKHFVVVRATDERWKEAMLEALRTRGFCVLRNGIPMDVVKRLQVETSSNVNSGGAFAECQKLLAGAYTCIILVYW